MENSSPENTITAVNKATSVIETRGTLDANFPDLRKTFRAEFVYNETKHEAVQPVILKESIILPEEGLEALQTFNPSANAAGIAPFINKAYFTIKNCLYLWDYTERKMIVHEEEDEIVGAAFVKPKAGVFAAEINQLLIISTIRQVKIIAASYNPTTGLKVFQTDLNTTASGVNMKVIVGTNKGRVFMLGNDGNVWELDYRSDETWFTGKCSKKLHTTSSPLSFIIPTTKDPVIQLAINECGNVLYQLTQNSNITVTYLGEDGTSFNTVLQCKDAAKLANSSVPNSPYVASKVFKIVSLNPTSPSESKDYQLVAITSNGSRLYFTQYEGSQHLLNNGPPNTLQLSHVRPPNSDVAPTDVFAHTYYKDGLLIGVKNQNEKRTEDRIVTYSPDLAAIANPNNIINSIPSYTEFNNFLDVPGKIISIVETANTAYQINELTAPFETPGRTFLVLTTYGMAVLVKQRPIDMLYKLICNANQDTAARLRNFESFFQYFGYVNSISLCLGILCSTSSIMKNGLTSVGSVTNDISKSITVLLENMGSAPSAINPQFSSRHDGLALFVYRVINPIWSKPFVKASSNDASAIYSSILAPAQLQRTLTVMRKLSNLMQEKSNYFLRSSNAEEQESLNNLNELIKHMTEGLSFIQYIINTDLSSIVKSIKPEAQKRLMTMTLKDLLTSKDGRKVASDLSYALVDYTSNKYQTTGHVIDVLTEHCGSFCSASNVFLHKAAQQIFSARSATNASQARAMLTESLNMLKKIALHIPADKAAEIAQDFAQQGYPVYGIELALACSSARDPHNTTNAYVKAGCSLNHPAAKTFANKQPFYDIVFDLLYKIVTKTSASVLSESESRNQVFKSAFSSCIDQAFAYYVFEKFIQNKMGEELIKQPLPYLEEFLISPPFDFERNSLLASFYNSNERYEEAARTYFELARAAKDIPTRIKNLLQASVSASSVTSPAKQYEMYQLTEAIKQNLENANRQSVTASQ
ncbi:Nup133 N terminal like-domain-containing protein [Mucor mucedo]|uniref:Nup133 N terminal like-domain-containing protein n=1 Tax=Mucor mucedo TaxID=29922 RepID=UPI00221FFDBE|nr:Nup133 N terminal like-domain-containing protein [Mucor mucedo]KAI7888861.1 Nup133 N terminal like-domain-containing protein [Mucor mucedo]